MTVVVLMVWDRIIYGEILFLSMGRRKESSPAGRTGDDSVYGIWFMEYGWLDISSMWEYERR